MSTKNCQKINNTLPWLLLCSRTQSVIMRSYFLVLYYNCSITDCKQVHMFVLLSKMILTIQLVAVRIVILCIVFAYCCSQMCSKCLQPKFVQKKIILMSLQQRPQPQQLLQLTSRPTYLPTCGNCLHL